MFLGPILETIGIRTRTHTKPHPGQPLVDHSPRLKQCQLLYPERLAGYNEFVQFSSPDRPPDFQALGEYYIKDSIRVGYEAPIAPLRWETVYRWELAQAWETLRQVALTRTFLLFVAEAESPTADWIRPDAKVIAALRHWASIANREFDRLDICCFQLGMYEFLGTPLPEKWVLDGFSLPDDLGFDLRGKFCRFERFPFPIFSHCKRINRGEDVLSPAGPDPASNPAAGLIRALVQHYQLHEPIASDSSSLSWWREWRSKLGKSDYRDWKGYPGLADFPSDLDVRSSYAKEVERWLLPPALTQTTGIPESDSAEEVDRKLSEMSDKVDEPSSTGPSAEAAAPNVSMNLAKT